MLKPLHKTCESFSPEVLTDWEKKFREAPVCQADGCRIDCKECQAQKWGARAPRSYFSGRHYASPF